MDRKRKIENLPTNDAKVRKISEFMCVTQSKHVVIDNAVDTEFRDQVAEQQSETLSQRPKLKVKRKFRDDWKYKRSWLIYNSQTRKMFCSVCQLANVTNIFTTGCHIMKKESVTKHEIGKGKNSHPVAIKIVQDRKDYTRASEAKLSKSESDETETMTAMKNVLRSLSSNLPNMSISDLNELCKNLDWSSRKSQNVDKDTCTSYEN